MAALGHLRVKFFNSSSLIQLTAQDRIPKISQIRPDVNEASEWRPSLHFAIACDSSYCKLSVFGRPNTWTSHIRSASSYRLGKRRRSYCRTIKNANFGLKKAKIVNLRLSAVNRSFIWERVTALNKILARRQRSAVIGHRTAGLRKRLATFINLIQVFV